MKKLVADFLQPADQFVQRPPLDGKSFWPLCGIGSCTLIVAVFLVGRFTFLQSFTIYEQTFQNCAILPEDASCSETTHYPKTIEVRLSPQAFVHVILNGPEQLSHSQIEDAILGMTCALNSSDGTIVYNTYGTNVPFNFQTTCTNPGMPQLTLQANRDEVELDHMVRQIKIVKQLNDYNLPENFEIALILIQRVFWWETGEWMGIAGAELQFEDGLQFAIWSLKNCWSSEPVISGYPARNCGFGAPYLGGNVYSHTTPDLRPNNFTDSFHLASAAYFAIISHPSFRTYDPRIPEQLSVMDSFAEQICEGMASSGVELLKDLEDLDPHSKRSVPELIKTIAESIDKQCPYSFTCKESRFQGPYIWIVIAYPLLIVVLKVFSFLMRKAYALLQKFFRETHPVNQSNENVMNEEHATDRRAAGEVATCALSDGLRHSSGVSNDFSEAVNVAVKQLFGDFDLEMLRRLPTAVSNIEERLLNVDTLLKGFHEQEPLNGIGQRSCSEREEGRRLPPAPYQFAPVLPSRLEGQDKSFKAVEFLIEDARQSLQNELNFALQSFKEAILKQLVGLPPQGAASQQITSNVDSRLFDERHQISVESTNIMSTFSPHEWQPHLEQFPQHMPREMTDPLSQPHSKLWTRSPAYSFAPGRHYI